MGARLEGKVERVIHASDLALLITERSITGTEPADGTPINLTGSRNCSTGTVDGY
jgi:hypothetical protein